MSDNNASNDNTPRRGGRPPQAQSGLIRERILEIATRLFLTQGYGATSIEAIAKAAGMSKRTFYHRFDGKAELFAAVVHRLVERMRPAHAEDLFKGNTLESVLHRIAAVILHAALSPEALALHRLMVSEAGRFPELVVILDSEGARKEAVSRIAVLLQQYLKLEDASFAAEQFLHMLTSAPRQRALGLGTAMTAEELSLWVEKTVQLFLNGCKHNEN